MSGAEASSLHGQPNFARGQYFGCSLKPTMVFLQKILRGGWSDDYQEELALVAVYTVAALRSCPPRVVSLTDVKTPVMVFTDGAYEPDGDSHLGSAGLVLIDRVSGIQKVCQVSVPISLCEHWRRFGAKQIILYLELWPILVFLAMCSGEFSTGRMIFYIDNKLCVMLSSRDPHQSVTYSTCCLCALTSYPEVIWELGLLELLLPASPQMHHQEGKHG